MQRTELEFKSGSILRKELIEDLYKYPRIAVDTYFASYSDGILYGLEWELSKENPNGHIIMPGSLKYHGQIYFLKEKIEVEIFLHDKIEIDNKYHLCFVEKQSKKFIETQTIYELEICAVQIEEYDKIKNNCFYYSRVISNLENKLNTFYEDEIYGLYASNDGYEYKIPYWAIKQRIIPIIENKASKHPLDYMILKEFYEKKGLSITFIKMYLSESCVELNKVDISTPNIVLNKLEEAIKLLKIKAVEYERNESAKESAKETKKFIHKSGGLL